MKHLAIIVSGRVQGVFYRASAKEQADSLRIKGFVRNEPNGDVYLEVEGEVEALEKLLEWCRLGPPRAQVTDVLVKELQITGFKNFEVRRG